MSYSQTLALEGAKRMAERFGTKILDNKTGTLTKCCLVNVVIPLDPQKMYQIGKVKGLEEGEVGTAIRDWMGHVWIKDHDTFIQSMFYDGKWWVRVSGQAYLEMADFEWAAETVKKVCKRAEKGEWAVKGKARL